MRKVTVHRLAAAVLGTSLGIAGLAVPASAAAPPLLQADTLPAELNFEDCPAAQQLPEGADPNIWQCNVMVIHDGRLQIGKIDQPFDHPVKLTYATGYDPVDMKSAVVMGPLETDPFRVSGGILGIDGSDVFPFMQVHAKPAAVADLEFPATNVQLRLKLKVQVQNDLVGDQCAIGSKDDPITLNLTFGTTSPPAPNQPISGEIPKPVSFDPLVIGATMVDNAFAVPKSSGCGFGGLLNGFVDWRAGLPSPAGTNTAIVKSYAMWKTYAQL